LPKLKSKILSYALREAFKNFPRITFSRDLREPVFFGFVAHASGYTSKPQYTSKCISTQGYVDMDIVAA
jgi:hypothetical protein